MMTPNIPRVLGYWPEMGQFDIGATYPAVEYLMNMGINRELVPILAESVKVDEKKPAMTFKLRKGIKFHDGSDLNAETMVWNFKLLLEGKKIRFGSLWATGWDDMVLFFSGLDCNYLQTAETWFGHEPLTNLVSFKRPPEFIALCKEAVKLSKPADQEEATKKIVRMIADEALITPLWNVPAAAIHQPWVHTNLYKTGFIHWPAGDDWMEKH